MTNQQIVLLHNHFDSAHLAAVIGEMKKMGPPTVRAYDLGFGGLIQAVEGCHRLRACEDLGIAPVIEIVQPEETVGDLELDADVHPDTSVQELGDWENYAIDLSDIDE